MTAYRIALGPEQNDLGNNRGPATGMFALQKALCRNSPDWFRITSGEIEDDEIPWVWKYGQAEIALRCHREKRPFIVGPNVLFSDSRKPCHYEYEQIVCDSPYCRLMFTESKWYEQLIRKHIGKQSKAELCVVPYPVTIAPCVITQGIALFDVLLYVKSGISNHDVTRLELSLPKHITFRYGHYDRDQLIEAANLSRLCVYTSDDDRGPLACAEILLAGCPIIGIERGCPWVREIYGVGYEVESLDAVSLINAVKFASRINLPRKDVRQRAATFFDPGSIAVKVFAALDKVRNQ